MADFLTEQEQLQHAIVAARQWLAKIEEQIPATKIGAVINTLRIRSLQEEITIVVYLAGVINGKGTRQL